MAEENTVDTGQAQGEKTFTQAEVDEMIQKRVARVKSKYEGYDQYKADSEELSKIKESQKTEIEKANERAAAAEKERDALKAERDIAHWKDSVSEETGIPANVLEGTTEEEIKDHAERLLPYFKKDAAPTVVSDGMKPSGSKVGTAELFAQSIEKLI